MSEQVEPIIQPWGRLRSLLVWALSMGAMIGGALVADAIGERFFPDDKTAQGSLIFPIVIAALWLVLWAMGRFGVVDWGEGGRSPLAEAEPVERWAALLPKWFWVTLIILVGALPTLTGWFTPLRMDDPWYDRTTWIAGGLVIVLMIGLIEVHDFRTGGPTRRAHIETHREDGQADIRYDRMVLGTTFFSLALLAGAWLIVTFGEGTIAGVLFALGGVIAGVGGVRAWLERRRYKAWQFGGDYSRSVFGDK